MKKILIIPVALLLGALSGNAQDSNPNVSAKSETTINGIPYSQYKAQQDALKQQKVEVVNAPKGLIATTGSSNEKPVAIIPAKEINVKGTSLEPVKQVSTKIVAPITGSSVDQSTGISPATPSKVEQAPTTKVEAAKTTEPGNVPPVLIGASKNSSSPNSNGTSPAKIETKVEPSGPGMKTKTD